MNYSSLSKKTAAQHYFYYWSGAIILLLNKLRHEIKGYLTPRPFSTLDIDQVISYDTGVVKNWLKELNKYDKSSNVSGLNILELGPGADLGVALNFLSLGANQYFALDKFKLIDQANDELYQKLIDRIAKDTNQKIFLQNEINLFKNSQSGKINYFQDNKFSLSHFANKKIDLIVSQAAFEHFINPAQVISELGNISHPGTKVVVQIDMMTHSRWIKDVDPQNIYRYSDFFYNLTKFMGSPNRWRPDDYMTAFKKAGFTNIKIVPINSLSSQYTANLTTHLNKKFKNDKKQMGVLDCYLLATKE